MTRYFSAATRPNIILGPDPNLSLLREGNALVPSNDCQSLFLPGTDNKEEQVPDDLVTGEAAFFVDNGAATFPILNDSVPSPIQDEQTGINGGDPQSSDKASSPLPMKTARRLCQGPKISFVFDDATGDFVKSHPTIFLPRPPAPPAPSPALRRSIRSRASPVNPDSAHLNAAQGSKSGVKTKKRDLKRNDKTSEDTVPHKHARNDDGTMEIKDKLAPKRPKLTETIVIDEDKREFFLYSCDPS